MNYISQFLNRITMYQAVLYALRAMVAISIIFAFFGLINFIWWHIAGSLILFLFFCAGTNLVLSKIYSVKPNFESQYITALILTLIVGPLNPITNWWIIFLISLSAMASKYILAYNKKHIFNPAAFGVLIGGLVFSQGASWWIGNQYLLPIVLVCGLLVLKKLRWFHLAGSYLTTYFLGLLITSVWQGVSIGTILEIFQSTALNSAVIFFASIMLIEPLTAPRTNQLRIYYGISIGVLMVIIPTIFPTYAYSIETALLAGNLLAFLTTKNQIRQSLKLKQHNEVASNTHEFIFEPYKKIEFTAGQFLEWTLPHKNKDSRGIRRFFTIASSPTQPQIRLITKSNPQMSSFKQALMKFSTGDEIMASHVGGDFILPKNSNTKLVFIAGGIGITPFLSMIQYLIDTQNKRDIVLLYANKSKDEIAFKAETSKAESIGVKTIHIISDNKATDWTGPVGLIDSHMVSDQIPDWQERMFFVSGPEKMVEIICMMLINMGVRKTNIKRDYFPGY